MIEGQICPPRRGTGPTLKLSTERARHLSRLLPPFLSPTSFPPCPILLSCPCGTGWQKGLEVQRWVGVRVLVRHISRGGLVRVPKQLSVCSGLTGPCWGQIQGALFPGQGEPVTRCEACHVRQMGGKWDRPLAHPTGTCRVRELSSVRLQLVTGLCSSCPLGLQGSSPAAWIWGP